MSRPTHRSSPSAILGDVVNSLKSTQIYDFLHVSSDKEMKKFFQQQATRLNQPEEILQFADSVIKINRKEKQQRRALIITNMAIYNFAFPVFGSLFSNFKRRIPIAEVAALVLSRCSEELVIQVINDYDYRFVISRRAEVVETINKCFQQLQHKELAVHFSEERFLRSEVKTKVEMERRRSVPNISPEELNKHRASAADTPLQKRVMTHGFRFRSTLREGWLAKKKGKAEKWEQKYFVLQRDRLSYFSARIKGNFSLVECRVIPSGPEQRAQLEEELDLKLHPETLSLDPLSIDPVAPSHSHPTSSSSSTSSSSTTTTTTSTMSSPTRPATPSASSSSSSSSTSSSSSSSSSPSRSDSGSSHTHPPAGDDWPLSRMTSLGGKFSRSMDDMHLDYYLAIIDPQHKALELAMETDEDWRQWIDAFRQAASARPQQPAVHLEGWLMKRDPTSKVYRRRYFVLHHNRLWYYEMNPKGEISLMQGAGAHTAQHIQMTLGSSQDFAGLLSHSHFAYRFNISAAERIYNVAADDGEDMAAWIEVIERAARLHTRGVEEKEREEECIESELPQEYVAAIAQAAPENQVTFVFTDVQSSTNLWEAAPDAMNDALETHDRILRELLVVFNGYEVKTEGDAFMVTFFRVIDALLWCMAVQQALLGAEWPEALGALPAARCERDDTGVVVFNGIRIRMGIHTGFPNCRRNPVTGRMDYFGPVVNLSARISDTAHGGQIVCSDEVKEALTQAIDESNANFSRQAKDFNPIATDMGMHSLKGIKELVKIWQVSSQALSSRQFPPLRAGKGGDTKPAGKKPAQLDENVHVDENAPSEPPSTAASES